VGAVCKGVTSLRIQRAAHREPTPVEHMGVEDLGGGPVAVPQATEVIVYVLSGQIGQPPSGKRSNELLRTLDIPAHGGGLNALLDKNIWVTIPETAFRVVPTSCRHEPTSCEPMEKVRPHPAAPATRDSRPGPC